MAKRVNEPDGGADKGGMRILYVELNGSNSSLQEGLRTLVAAMNKPVQVALPQRRLVANQHTSPAPEPESELFNQTAEVPEVGEAEQIGQRDSGSNGATRRPRGEGPKRDRNAGIGLVPDLDLVQESGTSLKDFFGQKNPSTAEEQVLVCAYYLWHHVKVSPIGPGHILTCFTDLNERKPLALKQTIRNLAKTKGWLTCADMSDLKLTTAGENYVKHVLGNADASGNGTK